MHRVQEKHFPPMKGNCKSGRCSTVKVPDFKHLKAVVIWLRVFTFQHVDITVVTESERWDHRFPPQSSAVPRRHFLLTENEFCLIQANINIARKIKQHTHTHRSGVCTSVCVCVRSAGAGTQCSIASTHTHPKAVSFTPGHITAFQPEAKLTALTAFSNGCNLELARNGMGKANWEG